LFVFTQGILIGFQSVFIVLCLLMLSQNGVIKVTVVGDGKVLHSRERLKGFVDKINEEIDMLTGELLTQGLDYCVA
jgi:hypothetical protein